MQAILSFLWKSNTGNLCLSCKPTLKCQRKNLSLCLTVSKKKACNILLLDETLYIYLPQTLSKTFHFKLF